MSKGQTTCDLIQNGGFETAVSSGPNWGFQIDLAANWASPTYSKADYCTSAIPSFPTFIASPGPVTLRQYGTPYNNFGHQNSKNPTTDHGYAMLRIQDANLKPGLYDRFPYIYQQLRCEMKAGITYTISMNISWAEYSDWQMNQLGFLITSTNPSNPINNIAQTTGVGATGTLCTPGGIPVVPTHEWALCNESCPPLPYDDDTWQTVSYNYTATGGEDFIVIGAFKTTPSLHLSYTTIDLQYGDAGYGIYTQPYGHFEEDNYVDYYIDEVSIVPATIPTVTVTGDDHACTPTGNYTINGLDNWDLISVVLDEPYDGTLTMTSGNTFSVGWDFSNAFTSGPETITVTYGLCNGSYTYKYTVEPCCKCSNDGVIALGSEGTVMNPAYLGGGHLQFASQLYNSTFGVNPNLPSTTTCSNWAMSGIDVQGQTFAIDGTFEVDVDLNLSECKLIMGKNAEIIVDDGVNFDVDNSWIHACCEMWQGITVYGPDGGIHVFNSMIEDARIAITSEGGGQYDIDQSLFNKNGTGLEVQNDNGPPYTTTLTNNVFTCRDFSTLSTSFVNTPCSSAGTIGSSVNHLITTEYNVSNYPVSATWPTHTPSNFASAYPALYKEIDGVVYTGLYPYTTMNLPAIGVRSQIGVELSRIADPTADPNIDPYTPIVIGDPVGASGGTLPNGIADNGQMNTFDYLDFGVVSYHSNVDVKNNVFVSIFNLPGYAKKGDIENVYTAGVMAFQKKDDISSRHLQVGDFNTDKANNMNYFFNCQNGVFATNVNNDIVKNNMYHILHHGIYLENGSNRKNHIRTNYLLDMDYGVETKDMANTIETIIDNQNRVEVNTYYNFGNRSSFGIGCFNSWFGVTTLLIDGNYVYQYNINTNNASTGIRLEGHGKSDIHNNVINFYTPLNNVNDPAYGILTTADDKCNVSENQITKIGYPPTSSNKDATFGIFNEDTKNTTVYNNTITNMGNGISAAFNCSFTGYGCNLLNANYDGFNFKNPMLPDQLPSYQATGNVWTGSLSNDIDGSVTQQPGYGGGGYLMNWYVPNMPVTFSPLIGIQVNFLTPTNTDDACGTGGGGGGGGTPPQIAQRELMLGRIVRGENTYDTLANEFMLYDSIYAYRALSKQQTWLNLGTSDDTTYQHFYNFCKYENVGKFEKVDEYLIDTLFADINSAQVINQNIPTHCTMEENKKLFNSIYLRKLAFELDTLNGIRPQYVLDSTTDVPQLQGIAYQNPIYGGEAVYQARTLLWIDVVDDLTVTPKSLKPKPKHPTAVSDAFNLYPNPNNGNMTLDYKLSENETGVISIYDVTGKLLKSNSFNSNNNSLSIDASRLDAGAYYYDVKVGDRRAKADKLIIVK